MGIAIRTLCALSIGSVALLGCSSNQHAHTSSWTADSPPSADEPYAQKVDERYIETVSQGSTYTYHYFPQNEVYFAPDRNLFFWQSQGQWTSGPQLPSHLNVDPNNSVEVPLYTDTPYQVHTSVSSAYPRNWRSAAQTTW